MASKGSLSPSSEGAAKKGAEGGRNLGRGQAGRRQARTRMDPIFPSNTPFLPLECIKGRR